MIIVPEIVDLDFSLDYSSEDFGGVVVIATAVVQVIEARGNQVGA